MTWKKLSEVKIRGRDGIFEVFNIQSDGLFYRIQNDFENVVFEFDVSSGYELVEELGSIIMSEINKEINSFMNDQDSIIDVNGTSDEVTSEFTSGDNDYQSIVEPNIFKDIPTVSR